MGIQGEFTQSNTQSELAVSTVEVKHIDRLATELKAEVGGLKKGNKTVDEILREAGSTSTQLKGAMAAICAHFQISCPSSG